MKKLFFCLSLIAVTPLLLGVTQESQNSVELQVSARQHAQVKLLLGIAGVNSAELLELAALLKQDFEFSKQFVVDVQTFADLNSKRTLKEIASKGYSLAVFLSAGSEKNNVEWRLYDVPTMSMLKGKKYAKRGLLVRGWGHNLADMIWPELTGQEGFFSTKIAYCKEVKKEGKRGKSKHLQHVYIADYDGSNEQLLVGVSTVSIAPRWNTDQKNPMVFYSEFTDANTRLVSVAMNKRRWLASNFDGLNMLPSFSSDGKKVVYCASRGSGNSELYFHEKGTFKKLTSNGANNIAPVFGKDEDSLYYCGDITGAPQIYSYAISTGKSERLTDSGYCTSPAYCSKTGKLAYCKLVSGTEQLFIYDPNSKNHTQLTFDAGHKDECSWSVCGNYLLCSVSNNKSSRLAMFNLITREMRFITSDKDKCSYPAWSAVYDQYPVVVA